MMVTVVIVEIEFVPHVNNDVLNDGLFFFFVYSIFAIFQGLFKFNF